MLSLNWIPTEFTRQEIIVSECLDELGLKYAQQVSVGKYVLDFVIEGSIVLEADGIYGHFRRRDKKRDEEIMRINSCYNRIVHIKSQSKSDIKSEIMEKLQLC